MKCTKDLLNFVKDLWFTNKVSKWQIGFFNHILIYMGHIWRWAYKISLFHNCSAAFQAIFTSVMEGKFASWLSKDLIVQFWSLLQSCVYQHLYYTLCPKCSAFYYQGTVQTVLYLINECWQNTKQPAVKKMGMDLELWVNCLEVISLLLN